MVGHQASTPLRGIFSSLAGRRNSIGLVPPSEKQAGQLRNHVGVMRGIIKNSGKKQTSHSESVAREHANNAGRRFFDLIEVDIAEKSLRAVTAAGIIRYGPDLAHIRSERKRLLRE